jgi:hypothetical protein
MSKEKNNDDVIRELLEEALKVKIEQKKEFNNHEELATSLGPIISEFLDSFIVIGYDFEGNPITFQGSAKPQQKDALDTLFLKYFQQRTGCKLIDGNDLL